MSDAEKLALRQFFIEASTGAVVQVKGLLSSFDHKLAAAGVETIYAYFSKRNYTLSRGAAASGTALAKDALVDELTGLTITVDGWPFDYPQDLSRLGAESLVDRWAVAGFVWSK
jgi:hypothetical protein